MQSQIVNPTSRVLTDIDEMYAAVDDQQHGHLWRQLGERHRRLIADHGFENFKRTINFQYGQWAVSTYRSRFTLRLLAALMRRGRMPRLARADFADAEGIMWATGLPAAKRLHAYAFYCGLLWQYAGLRDRLQCLGVKEPAFGHPMPVYFGSRLISQDLAMASLTLNAIARFVRLGSIRRVLEIGGGYGRMAYLMRSLFPEVQYIILDIPPALAVSQNYLSAVMPEDNIARFGKTPTLDRPHCFLLPHQATAIPDGYFDLVINFSSFDEMPSQVVLGYLELISRVSRGHVYLGGYGHPAHPGDFLGLEEFPYEPQWQLLFSQKHEIFSGFVEKVFKLS
jgi:SAM-dependent methyltransferase